MYTISLWGSKDFIFISSREKNILSPYYGLQSCTPIYKSVWQHPIKKILKILHVGWCSQKKKIIITFLKRRIEKNKVPIPTRNFLSPIVPTSPSAHNFWWKRKIPFHLFTSIFNNFYLQIAKEVDQPVEPKRCGCIVHQSHSPLRDLKEALVSYSVNNLEL